MKNVLRLFKKILIFSLVLVSGTGVWICWEIVQTLPKTKGAVKTALVGDRAEIWRDSYGVPHIFANNQHDLFFALGYATAQDRLWQMEMFRRLGSGTLSEVIGPAMLGSDKNVRTLGLRRMAEQELLNLSPEVSEILQAYSEGINGFIHQQKSHLPLGFRILKFKPQPWTPSDSLVILKLLQLMFATGGELQLVWEALGASLDPLLLRDLVGEDWSLMKTHTNIRPVPAKFSDILKETLRGQLYAGGLVDGSNCWAVDGTMSASGKPMLASDPHTELRIPSYWHEIHLSGAGYQTAGIAIAGMPVIYIGCNASLAWGITRAYVDDTDLYIEKAHPQDPSLFLKQGRWKKFRETEETIAIKGQKAEKHVVRHTDNGVVYSENLGEKQRILTMRWIGFTPDQNFQAVLGVMRSRTVRDALKALEGFGAPPLNFHLADAAGHIAYVLAGRIPNRSKAAAVVPVPAWEGRFDWKEFVPFEENPKSIDPDSHFTASANNKMQNDHYPHYVSVFYATPYRIDRIEGLLKDSQKFRVEDFSQFQNDIVSTQAKRLVPGLVRVLSTRDLSSLERQCLDRLSTWDFRYTSDGSEPLIFHVFFNQFMELAFKKQMGERLFERFKSLYYWASACTDRLLEDGGSGWLKLPGLTLVQSREALIHQAFQQAVQKIAERLGADPSQWRWGAGHLVGMRQQLLRKPPWNKWFDVGPFEMDGSGETLKRGSGYSFDGTMSPWGAGYRFVADLGEGQRYHSVLVPGQSGLATSKNYKDQMDLWLEGKLKVVEMDAEILKKERCKILELLPSGSKP